MRLKPLKFKIHSSVYPLEAILNTAYNFLDRAYIFLDNDVGRNLITVSIKGKKKFSQKKLEKLHDEFMNELLHSALRCQISKNNKKIREYIIGRALYSALPTSDLASSDEKLDYQEDPLGIAIPWEEKYGKKKNAKKNGLKV